MELEGKKNVAFHVQDLRPFVGVFGYIDEVLHRGRVNFLVLGRDEERCHADELSDVFFNSDHAEVTVDQVDGNEQSFGEQLEFAVDVDEPVNQDCATLLIHVGLALHVGRVGLGFALRVLHVLLDFGTKLCHLVNVRVSGHVNSADFADHVLVHPLFVHLPLGAQPDFRQLVARTDSGVVRGDVAGHRFACLGFDLVEVDRPEGLLQLAGGVDISRIQT